MPNTYFSPAQLDKIISDTLPKLPDNRTGAVVLSVDDKGAGVVGLFTKHTETNDWSLNLAVKRDWDGNISAGTKVIWSF